MEETKNQRYNLWVVIGIVVVLVFSVAQSFTILSHKKGETGGNSISGATTSGSETYDEMMARMHPDQVAAQSGGNNMVGGC